MKKLFYWPSAQRRSAVMQVAKRILPILFGLKLEALNALSQHEQPKATSQNFKQSVAPARVRLSPTRNLSTPQFSSRRKVSIRLLKNPKNAIIAQQFNLEQKNAR